MTPDADIVMWTDGDPEAPTVAGATVAIVPARNPSQVGATVAALLATGRVDAVVVVDDGSTDDTADRAAAAGANVVTLPSNQGKGGAVAAGRSIACAAEIYLLIDADLGETAATAVQLLDPLERDDADMAVAVFPPANGRGGFGIIKRGSARAVQRLCGLEVAEPLSGQRAIRGPLFRELPLAARFGLEVGLTVDAVRRGARVVEMPLPLEHEHTGRTLGGFRHRARQGLDIVRAVVPRVGTSLLRCAVMITVAIAVVAAAFVFASSREVPNALEASTEPVVVVTLAYGSLADLGTGVMPYLDRMTARAGGSLAPRTPSLASDQASGYATAGAGAPLVLVPPGSDDLELEETAGLLELDDETLGAGPFVAITAGDEGMEVSTPLVASTDTRSFGDFGALGDALGRAGVATAYVGARSGGSGGHAPGSLLVADSDRRLGHAFFGSLPLSPTEDLETKLSERVDAVRAAIDVAGVVVVDTGGAPVARPVGAPPLSDEALAAREVRRLDQIRVADAFLGALEQADLPARVLVVGLAPPPPWRLTPTALIDGPDGVMWSESTRQPGISVLTDVAPTVLSLLGLPTPDSMVGRPIGVGPGPADPDALGELAVRSEARDRVYVPAIMTFVIAQGVVYLLALWALRRRRNGDPAGQRWLGRIERLAVAFTAFPVTTFLWRALPAEAQEPWIAGLGYAIGSGVIAAVALRFRRHPLSPLVAVAGLTVAVLAFDAATAGALQHLSLLGYTPVTAARFYGVGNMGFAVFGATTVLLAGAWVALSPVRRDGLVAAASLMAVVTILEISPSLGADFGGVLSFVPVFGGMLLVWAGLRFTWTRLVLGGFAGLVVVAAVTWWELRSGGDTHLGRFVTGDVAEMREVIVRKAATNFRVMRITFWTWMVPIILTFIIGSLTVGGGWRRWFGGARSWRLTFVGMIVFGVVGGLVNDSGIVIPALALVYVGAFLLMVQSRQPFGPAVFRRASPSAGS